MNEFFEKVADAVVKELKAARIRNEQPDFAGTIWWKLGDYQGDRERAFKIVQRIISRRSAEKRRRNRREKKAVTETVRRQREANLAHEQERSDRDRGSRPTDPLPVQLSLF